MQSVLASAREDLLSSGINYPNHNSLKDAVAGKITSGNGIHLIDALEGSRDNRDFDDLKWFGHSQKICFSSEFLFTFLLPNKTRHRFFEFLEKNKIEKTHILLLIRNPIDQVASGYQQFIKRGGGSDTIAQYCKAFKMPVRVKKFIEDYGNHDKIVLTVKNYSTHAHELDQILFDFLQTENLSKVPPSLKVNRSLGISELLMQKEFNKVLGKSGEIFSDPLCDQLPDLKVEKIYPEINVARKLIENNRAAMEFVNDAIDVDEAYDMAIPQTCHKNEPQDISFTEQQLQIIGKNIGTYIQSLKDKIAKLESDL